ncbi:MAG: HD domain-containing protein [Selenomonas montiformis]|uniref:HD domain-containing protein n=1 Tax=Selenomonas montiformis TaxID=2652285 RepID=UPI002A8D1535|nr:HD domain-containing protein [Selenomonas montiformis]
MDKTELLNRMIAWDQGDPRRIQHALKVYQFASLIGRMEGLPGDVQDVLEIAAILHDIGIHAAEKKYGSTAGKYQEQEGGPLAEQILHELGIGAGIIERVRFLVEHHHTYTGVDGMDYQILLEADFLVNAYEDELSPAALRSFRDNVFRTESGRKLLQQIYGIA